MKTTRNLVSLLLCLLLVMSCFAASADELEMSDVAGMTAAGVLPIVTEDTTLVLAMTQHPNVIDLDTNAQTLMLEELSGINLEFAILPTEETNSKVDLMIASGEKLPDLLMEGVSDIYYYGSNGIIVPMNDYFEKYSYFWNETVDKLFTEEEKTIVNQQMYACDGNIYAYPFRNGDKSDGAENCMYINQKWLDALGLDMPTTTDELYDVLVAFRDGDPNGNGSADELPMIGYATTDNRGDVVGDLLNAFTYYPYNNKARLVIEDGVVSSALTKDALREGLRYCKKLYDEGLISPLSFTQTNAELKAIINRPSTEDTIAGVIATHPSSGLCGWAGGLSDEYDKVMEYEALPAMIGPEGVCYAARVANGYSFSVCITKDCATPEAAFRLLDLMSRADVSTTARYGKQGVSWEYAKEGELDRYGNQAFREDLFALSGETQYWTQESQNEIWVKTFFILGYNMGAVSIESSNPYSAHNGKMFYSAIGMRDGLQPEEMYLLPIYNEEEKAVIDDLEQMIKDTADEWRTMFVTGEKDLDADWDEYLAQLDALGLEDVIAAAQSCYTRMAGK